MGLVYSLRQFAKNPGFTIIAVLTLALGIGANTAIFSFVNFWLIHPVSFPNQDRLVVLFETDKKTGSQSSVAPADWLDWRAKSQMFDELGAAAFNTYNLTGAEEPQQLAGYQVSANFFRTLGTKPALGRDFSESETQAGQDHVAILSHELWRDRFSSDPNVLGRTIMLDDTPTTIIGVTPERFQYIPMGLAQVFTPLTLTPAQRIARDSRFLRPVGRLKAGVSVASATSVMTGLQSSLEKEYPATNAGRGVIVKTLADEIERQSGNSALQICFAIVFFVLLMACSNVANLIMARATGRRKEMAVRMAMGAGRARLMRQLLSETLLLFVAGAAGGVAFAKWGVAFLLRAIPARSLPYLPNYGRAEVEWQVLLFTLGVALLTGLVFGLAPAMEGTRLDLNTALKDSGRGTDGKGSSRFRKVLVAGEMTLAVIVVVCGALLVNSFARMKNIDPGFDGRHVIVAEMQLGTKYKTPASIAQFSDLLLEKTAALGGVERTAVAMYTPFSENGNQTTLTIEGKPEVPVAQRPLVRRNFVTAGYMETLGIGLIAGRTISRQDTADSTPSVVINETLAKRYFPGENPLEKQIRMGARAASYTIVGVVKEIKYYDPGAPPENQAYLAFAQSPTNIVSLIAKTPGDATAVAQSMRAIVRAVDPNQPVSRIVTIETKMDEAQAGTRILTQIVGFFGSLALLLAAVGIYGVMAYSVSQRSKEIGIRMALGARGGNVLGLVIRQGMGIVLSGMVVGVAGAYGVARMLSRFMFGIQASDPVTFAGSFAMLAAVALVACWIPAQRAAKVDPVVALRSE
jgi:putative ABC transport system permease protein